MNSPILNGRPVIVVHLETSEGSKLTACTGDPFTHPSVDQYDDIPRTLCPGCLNAVRRNVRAS